MKYLVYIFCFAFIFSCNSKEKNENIEENVAGKKVYDMYQPSEMSTLMNEMYAENLKIKNEILAGNTPEVFPTDFLKIHTAQLSDFKKRNAKFEAFSKLYIVAEQDVFNSESAMPVKDRFNNAVGICISCHQTECTGPIPRIKKLLIK